MKTGNNVVGLSEEYLVDCDGTVDDANDHADCSIFGGWPYIAYQFIINSNGIPSEKDYPYCAGKQSYNYTIISKKLLTS